MGNQCWRVSLDALTRFVRRRGNCEVLLDSLCHAAQTPPFVSSNGLLLAKVTLLVGGT